MFVTLTEMVSLGVLACAGDGTVSHANSRACELVGGGAVLGSDSELWLRRLSPRTPSGIEMQAEDLPPLRALAGERIRCVDVLVSVAGHDRLLETAADPVYGRRGRIRGAVVTLQDVTDRRCEEARARRLRPA